MRWLHRQDSLASLVKYDRFFQTTHLVYYREGEPLRAPRQWRVQEVSVNSMEPHELMVPVAGCRALVRRENRYDFIEGFCLRIKKSHSLDSDLMSLGFLHSYLLKSNIEWYCTKPFKPKISFPFFYRQEVLQFIETLGKTTPTKHFIVYFSCFSTSFSWLWKANPLNSIFNF